MKIVFCEKALRENRINECCLQHSSILQEGQAEYKYQRVKQLDSSDPGLLRTLTRGLRRFTNLAEVVFQIRWSRPTVIDDCHLSARTGYVSSRGECSQIDHGLLARDWNPLWLRPVRPCLGMPLVKPLFLALGKAGRPIASPGLLLRFASTSRYDRSGRRCTQVQDGKLFGIIYAITKTEHGSAKLYFQRINLHKSGPQKVD